MRFTPHEYQQRGASFLVSRPEAALLYEPGLGKTAVVLTAFNALRRVGAVRKALVVAPLRVAYLVWSQAGELGKWDDFRGLRVSLLHGPKKAEALAQDADVYVINYDGLAWLTEPGRLADLVKRGVDLLVLDELSRLKHPKTQRFRALKPWLGRFKRRWGLTGTPVSNGLLDLFGEMYCLDLGASLGRFITHYRQKYFIPTGFGNYTWVPQHDAEPRIFAAIAPLAQSLKATDALDLPELVERDVFVELPTEARRVYAELERELITIISDTTVTAANAAVALGKCLQICGGALYHGDEYEWLPVHEAKLDAVRELVDELQGQPLIIAYAYQHELARLRAVFGDATPVIGGGVSMRTTTATVDAWNAGEVPILLVHPAACGHGLNLQRGGSHLCWFTLSYDLELYDQLIRRLWRQGSGAARVIVHRLLARATVDLAVRDALATKRGGQAALFAALRRHGGLKAA